MYIFPFVILQVLVIIGKITGDVQASWVVCLAPLFVFALAFFFLGRRRDG